MTNNESVYIPKYERPINLEDPILRQIPEYHSLEKANGESIHMRISGKSGKKYDIEIACMFKENDAEGEYVFGMWEKHADTLKPLGLLACTTNTATPESASIGISRSTYLQGDEKFFNLDDIAAEGGDQALRIRSDYQNEGLATHLIAVAYMVLEAKGVKKVKVLGDTTLRINPLGILESPKGLPLVQGTKNTALSESQTLVQPEQYTSIYTKFATQDQVVKQVSEGYEETVVSTHLAGPQVTMLLEAVK